MKSNALINVDSIKVLERVILVTGSTVLLTIAILLGSSGLTHFQQIEAKSNLALSEQQIRVLQETIDKSKLVKYTANRQKELNQVQTAMDQLADRHHCDLQELTSTNDTVPFVTRYKKGVDEKGWKQLSMSGQIVGSLTNVMAFLRGLSMMTVPIELGSIEVIPVGPDPGSKVSAKITFQILKQEGAR